jgi:iron complex outermembrane receptor protein
MAERTTKQHHAHRQRRIGYRGGQQRAWRPGLLPVTFSALLAGAVLPQAQAQETLPQIDVSAESDKETAKGPVRGYVARRSATGSKTDSALIETPQAISVITRDQMEDRGALNLQETMRYSAGIRAEAYGFDNRGDWSTVRGVAPVIYLDGLQMSFGSYTNIRPDVYMLERVEVLHGPSSVLYGQGSVGGIVNMTSKMPQAERMNEIGVQLGLNNRKQISGDFTGAFDDDGKLLYRLVVVGRESDTDVDYVPDNRTLVAPSLTWRPNADTSLTLYARYQKDVSGSSVGFFPWRGTLYAAPNGQISTSRFISEPGFDDFTAKQRSAGYQFEHKFSPNLAFRQNLRYTNSEVNYQSIYARFGPAPALNADNRSINRTVYINRPQVISAVADTQLEARLNSGALQHTLLAGLDYQRAVTNGVSGSGNTTAIDVYTPVYGNYTLPVLRRAAEATQRQTGVYLQDQIKFGAWTALLAVRRDWSKSDTVNTPSAARDDTALTKRAGLVYQFENGIAPYISYAESFQPLGGFDFYNTPYKPTRGKQTEVGVKFQPAGSRSSYTAALYDLSELNRKTTDPANPSNSIQIGEAQVRGLELEATTELNRQWTMTAGYSYTDAKVARSNGTDNGKRLAGIPEHMASLWATYRFNGALAGLTLGGGARYVGTSYDGMDNNPIPSVTLADAMMSYNAGAWMYRFNVNNLFDKTYVSVCLSRGDCFYGARRSAVLSATYRF